MSFPRIMSETTNVRDEIDYMKPETEDTFGDVVEIRAKRQLIVRLTTINEEEAIAFLARNYTILERAELIKYAMREFPDNEIAQGTDFTIIWKLSERCRKAVPVRNELRRRGKIDEPFAEVVRDKVALVFSDTPHHKEQG